MRRYLNGILVLLVVTVASVAATGQSLKRVDWPQWRGPDRSGVTQAVSGWSDGQRFRAVWKADVGRGYSSPILVDGRCYVMGWRQKGSDRKPRGNPTGSDILLCLDANSGKELWRASYASRYQGRYRTGDTGRYGGPNSTPTFDSRDGRLYTLGIDGELACWDTRKKGQRIWRVNLYDQYGGATRPSSGGGRRDFGMASSPLVMDDWIIVTAPTKKGALLALHRQTGKLAWCSAFDGPAGHSSGPVPFTHGGKPAILTLALRKLVLVDASPDSAGQTLATFDWATKFGCNLPTPAVSKGRVLLTSGYNNRATVLLKPSGKIFSKVWKSSSSATVSSPVIHGQRGYLVSGSLQCFDLQDGRRVWRGGRFGNGSCLVTGDGKCLVWGRGTLALVDASSKAKEYRELASIGGLAKGTCSPQVAFDGRQILVRDHGGRLVCVELTAKE